MGERKKSLWQKTITQVIVILPVLYRIVNGLLATLEYETKVAKEKVSSLILLCFFFTAILASVWLSLLGFIFILLTHYFTQLVTLTLILIFNILILIIIWLLIKNNLARIFIYPQTRELIKSILKNPNE